MTAALPPRGLYVLTQDSCTEVTGLCAAVRAAIAGGAVMVQYRDKSWPAPSRRIRATAVQRVCAEHGVPLIINDDVALAAAIGAAGVHLGKDDTAPEAARVSLGAGALIGVSCYDSVARAEAAVAAGADYVAFGSFYASRSKPQAAPCSLAVLELAASTLAVPIVAIGGITPDNAAALVARGATHVAVIDAVFGARDPAQAARRFHAIFHPT